MGSERERAKRENQQVSDHDDGVAPGRTTRSSQLDAPKHPIDSGLLGNQANAATQPHSYSEHVAAPAKLDFGKVSPGGFERVEGGMVNLTSAQCAVQVSYSGSPAIHLVHAPTRLAAKGETMSPAEQTIELQFNAPPTKGTHHGAVTASVQWWGGPQPDTLTVPVVAHALDISDETAEERMLREQRAKEAAAGSARDAKRKASEDKKLEAFEKAHPRVATDEYDRRLMTLMRTVSQFEQQQLNGVTAAEDEVLKYRRGQPPAQKDTFELAMLVLDIVSAGIAGRLGRIIELKLRNKLLEPTVTMIIDTVKESIKGTSKLARKHALAAETQKQEPAIGGDPAPKPGKSADPRVAFFESQRDGLISGQSDRTNDLTHVLRHLMPTLHATPQLAYDALEQMTAAYRELLVDTSKIVTHESIRQWINAIAVERLDVHHAGTVDSKPINEIIGVIDIGFQSPSGPKSPTIVKQAIIRGVSNAIAHRFQNLKLRDTRVPIRAYGLPGGNYAELPVAVLYGADGQIVWDDQTNGMAPATAATWLRQKGGAKNFMDSEILNRSLTQHGVRLTTDQDPMLEGG
jgi:hypothetical protein